MSDPQDEGDDFDRRMAGFVVATADQSDPLIDESVKELLRVVREVLAIDVAFVSRFERSQRIAELPTFPFPVGAHLSTPIVGADGSTYGALCCFRFTSSESLTAVRDLKRLQMAARLAAKVVDQAKAGERCS